MNGDILYLVVDALVVAAGVFAYMFYQERQKAPASRSTCRQKRNFYREEDELYNSRTAPQWCRHPVNAESTTSLAKARH